MDRRCSAMSVAVAIFAGKLAAQAITIQGTGDPDVDVPAVQAAVDQGGRVVLMGHFSFDMPPTQWLDHVNGRTVLVTKPVAISGTTDENSDMTTIEGGINPFAVDALGGHVTIRRLHFVRSTEYAIVVHAVSGLLIEYCRFERQVERRWSRVDMGILIDPQSGRSSCRPSDKGREIPPPQ